MAGTNIGLYARVADLLYGLTVGKDWAGLGLCQALRHYSGRDQANQVNSETHQGFLLVPAPGRLIHAAGAFALGGA